MFLGYWNTHTAEYKTFHNVKKKLKSTKKELHQYLFYYLL